MTASPLEVVPDYRRYLRMQWVFLDLMALAIALALVYQKGIFLLVVGPTINLFNLRFGSPHRYAERYVSVKIIDHWLVGTKKQGQDFLDLRDVRSITATSHWQTGTFAEIDCGESWPLIQFPLGDYPSRAMLRAIVARAPNAEVSAEVREALEPGPVLSAVHRAGGSG